MAIETLVALQVTNDEKYTMYREKMAPILKNHKGRFGYDFKISEVLKSEINKPVNRVFTICFENKDDRDSFFSNEEYLKVKKMYFLDSVTTIKRIATYTKEVQS